MRKRRKRFLLQFDRIISHDIIKQLLIPVALLVVAYGLSCVLLCLSGNGWRVYCAGKNMSLWAFPFYLLVDVNAFSNLYMSGEVSAWTVLVACSVYLAGIIIFSGMIVSILTNMISRRVERHRGGKIYYLKSGHFLIMGYDKIVPSLIARILSKDKNRYVLLLTTCNIDDVREEIDRRVPEGMRKRIVINYGHRTSMDEYKHIQLEKAEEIFIVGNRLDASHDATNIDCLDRICTYLNSFSGQRPGRITCVFEDIDTYTSFKTTDIFDEIGKMGIALVPFNFYAEWAQKVLIEREYTESRHNRRIQYPSVYAGGIGPDEERHVHLVFVGVSPFSSSFAIQAAHALHFPNYPRFRQQKTRITFIDQNAEEERLLFMTRNRHFAEIQPILSSHSPSSSEEISIGSSTGFLDTEIDFVNGSIFSSDIQKMIVEWVQDERQILSLFLTMENQRENFIVAMNMPDEVYEHGTPIFIRQDESDCFVNNLRKEDSRKDLTYCWVENGKLQKEVRRGRYSSIYPFGMYDADFCTDEKNLKRAKLINYLYQNADYTTFRFKEEQETDKMAIADIWKKADDEWQKLPVALKWSNLYQACSIPCKLTSLRRMRGLKPDDDSHDLDILTPEETEMMAICEHNRWNVERLLLGYRKSKPFEDKYVHQRFADDLSKNKQLFIHHDIRPFSELDDVRGMDCEISIYLPWILKLTS